MNTDLPCTYQQYKYPIYLVLLIMPTLNKIRDTPWKKHFFGGKEISYITVEVGYLCY